MNLTTLRYRIKDSTASKRLVEIGYSVNFVWNYCNEVNQESWKKFNKPLSAFDLNKMTAGCAKELGLHSQTVQAVCEEYAKSCKQFKKRKLNWRSRKKSLGWIPFKSVGVKVNADTVTYNGHTFKFWLSRPIDSKIRFGSFCQDSKGHWFVNFIVEQADIVREKTAKEVGIDLGLKTLATLSDGVEFSRENLTKKFEMKLAVAQRAKKKRRTTAIHAKIKNKRKDWNHKVSTAIVNEYDKVVVGNVSSSKLIKTRMAKSVSDASWSDFKMMLVYKSIRVGVEMKEVNENFSTVTCSQCGSRTGPKGQAGLRVREWICLSCGTAHHRDVNAAMNILHSVPGMERQRESPSL